jgi:hypothetical protein
MIYGFTVMIEILKFGFSWLQFSRLDFCAHDEVNDTELNAVMSGISIAQRQVTDPVAAVEC